MTDEDEIHRLSDRDYLTGIIINIHEARYLLSDGRIGPAEECLAVAERMAIPAGAKDIGPIDSAQDLPDSVFDRLGSAKDENRKLQERIEELEKTQKELRETLSDDDQ